MPASHLMDTYPVDVGDQVFDVGLGGGTVVELLLDNRFVVQFYPTNRRVAYRTSGVAANRQSRSLFWHDPVIAVPAKSEARWLATKRACASIVTEIRGL